MCFMDSRPWNAALPVFCRLVDASKMKSMIFQNRLVDKKRRIATALIMHSNLIFKVLWRLVHLLMLLSICLCTPKSCGKMFGTFASSLCCSLFLWIWQNLALCTASLMYILSRDRLNMDLDRSCLELMISLLELEQDDSVEDQLTAKEMSRVKEKIRKLCETVHNKHLDLENITVSDFCFSHLWCQNRHRKPMNVLEKCSSIHLGFVQTGSKNRSLFICL